MALHFTRSKWIALAAVIVATAAAVWFFYFRTDDATAVRKRLRDAVAYAEKQPQGSGFNLRDAGAAHALGDFFAVETDVAEKSLFLEIFYMLLSGLIYTICVLLIVSSREKLLRVQGSLFSLVLPALRKGFCSVI